MKFASANFDFASKYSLAQVDFRFALDYEHN